MKQIYKDPILYYILVPVVMVLWPLFVWGIYLPNTRTNWEKEKIHYQKAQKIVAEILEVDPDRLSLANSKGSAEFDYAVAIAQTASNCNIKPSNYKLSSGMM